MNNFKIGDKVVYDGTLSTSVLKKGDVCVVEESLEPFITARCIDTGKRSKGVFPSRFKLYSPYPNPPHVHSELIKAWADGAEIEYFSLVLQKWCQITKPPLWDVEGKYQIKPPKSERELKIEDLRKQARDLADELDKLEKM